MRPRGARVQSWSDYPTPSVIEKPKARQTPFLRLTIERIRVDSPLESRKQLDGACATAETHARFNETAALIVATGQGRIDADQLSGAMREPFDAGAQLTAHR